MAKEKKLWFIAYRRTFWYPVSWEAWAVITGFCAAIGLIYTTNHVSDNVPLSFARHWPILIELIVTFLTVNLMSRGHIDKKY